MDDGKKTESLQTNSTAESGKILFISVLIINLTGFFFGRYSNNYG